MLALRPYSSISGQSGSYYFRCEHGLCGDGTLVQETMNKVDGTVVKIYDTTLRDGTQGEGISFSVEDKLQIASGLDDFGIDYI